MPSSMPRQLNEIMDVIMALQPQSVLDVGTGFGKFGVLCREYLELWDGREQYADWQRRIDGIEIFPDYVTPLHRYIYNQVHLGDALDILPTIKASYDLVLLIDVLEHFTPEDAARLLQECTKHCRHILIVTPRKVKTQGPAFGNPHEAHKSQWTLDHFSGFPKKMMVFHPESLILLLSA